MVLSVPSIATQEEITTENCVHGSSQYIYKAGKKIYLLCGRHGLFLWLMFGYFPLWFCTYHTLPDRRNKNLAVIANRFNLVIDTGTG